MSLQVNDPRSRSRSKSPGRIRERSRSRDGRTSTVDLEPPRSRPRSRSPAVEVASKSSSSRDYDLPRARSPAVEIAPRSSRSGKSSRDYDPDVEAEVDRRYKLMKEERLRESGGEGSRSSSRVPRTTGRYDVERSDSEESRRRRGDHRDRRQREDARYEHSDEDRDLRKVRPRDSRDPRGSKDSLGDFGHTDPRGSRDSFKDTREYTDPRSSKDSLKGSDPRGSRESLPRDTLRDPRDYAAQTHRQRPSSPLARDSRLNDSDEDSDDGLAYGDTLGDHPSYARPGNYQYAQMGEPEYHGHPDPRSSDWAPIPECERPGFIPPASHPSSQAGPPSTMPGGFPSASPYTGAPTTSVPSTPMEIPQSQVAYTQSSSGPYSPSHYRTVSAASVNAPVSLSGYYAQPAQYQYAQVDPNVRYTSKATPVQPYTASAAEQVGTREPQPALPYRYSSEPQFSLKKPQPQPQPQPRSSPPSPPAAQEPHYQYQQPPTQLQYRHGQGHGSALGPQQQSAPPQLIEITPGGGRGRPHSLSVSSANNLTVTGGQSLTAGHPPASPLLEAYHGTYQSISPMPSPIVMPARDDDLSDMEPLDGGSSNSESGRLKKHTRSKSSTSEREVRYMSSKDKAREKEKDRDSRIKDDRRHHRHDSGVSHDRDRERDRMVVITPGSGRKRVSFYDAAGDALDMQSALSHRTIDNKTIIRVLPRLTSDEILLLRAEYKNRVKMQGKGINLAKHIRLKLGNSSFGKVAYATALGRWESEAYWANCYYQAGTSRRELLIESLIGRSNAAIREIKSSFRDTRYDNSLERCMRAELKADKFRTAVLLALEERRQEEREPIDDRLIRQDVQDLHRALISREGGETAMINVIVTRSDTHLREVLREYEAVYRTNFARAMIAKSRNLVGETLAHILNGAINRPMRDALLLHQAVRESRTGRERSELLISRLVRLHWEPRHLEQVKIEYRRRYNERIEEAIAEEVMSSATGSDWGEFCIELARSSS
ncbi:hypothetical protein POX_g08839 [Penicillium oxalicum]|uniref:hypothetical protein n=1 Tax=Penicillium oxalicum TaxID=69781 RepID=UPI0020B6597D|nr:hypothetical protein POX_g08839 [Penicillium oxalicum]KAI2786453.1 hypothetical protein POX_g08839 [Penicillium oxalicum]